MTAVVTAATGGRTMPIAMTITDPARAFTTAELEAAVMPGSERNVVFIADSLSAFLAHERAALALHRVAAGLSDHPELVGKYEELAVEPHLTAIREAVAGMQPAQPEHLGWASETWIQMMMSSAEG